jgi:hypothetical protein
MFSALMERRAQLRLDTLAPLPRVGQRALPLPEQSGRGFLRNQTFNDFEIVAPRRHALSVSFVLRMRCSRCFGVA